MPALARVPGSRLIGISTPYRKSGLLYEKWQESYGKPDPDILVVRGTSRQFNPTLSQRTVDAALQRDREAAGSEWLAEWRSDISDYIDPLSRGRPEASPGSALPTFAQTRSERSITSRSPSALPVIVEAIPRLTPQQRNEARRFNILIEQAPLDRERLALTGHALRGADLGGRLGRSAAQRNLHRRRRHLRVPTHRLTAARDAERRLHRRPPASVKEPT